MPYLVLLLQASKPSKMRDLKPESFTQKPLHDGNLSSRICWNMACVLFRRSLTVDTPVAGSQVLLPSGLMSFLEIMLGVLESTGLARLADAGTWVVSGLPGDVSAAQRFPRSNMVLRVRKPFHGRLRRQQQSKVACSFARFVPRWIGVVGLGLMR